VTCLCVRQGRHCQQMLLPLLLLLALWVLLQQAQ
jgi:hypothetical protein